MRLLFLLAVTIACSGKLDPVGNNQSVQPETTKPQQTSCRATHDDPFKCVSKRTTNSKFSPYSLSINNKLVPPQINAKIPEIPHNFFQLSLYSNPSDRLVESLRYNLFAVEIDLTGNFGYNPIQRHYWEPDSARWSYIIERQVSPAPLAELAQASWVNRAWEQVLQKRGLQKVEFFTRDGCAGHCIITTRYPAIPNYRISEINEYVGGLSIRHQILVERVEKKQFVASHVIIEIDPSGTPNLVYLFDHNFTILSRTGAILSSAPHKTFQESLLSELSARDHHQTIGNHSIVICDTGAYPSELSNFRVGPLTEYSFWGWTSPLPDSDGLSLWEQLSGVYCLSEINYGYNHGPVSISRHHEFIARLATENTQISTINITANQCFSHYNQWKENVRPYARVISVSSTFPYDFDSCQNEPRFKNSIGDPEQPFLWIVGAGNDHKKNLVARDTFYCPQSLGPLDNMIVVSAIDANYSNDGFEYADIAADGTFGKAWGTSFATPRVARVAAMLAEEFPNLSIAQIKQAIMKGARIPTPRLANRSGGILDEEGARRIAKQLLK